MDRIFQREGDARQNVRAISHLTIHRLLLLKLFISNLLFGYRYVVQFVVQLLSCASLFVTPWTAACQVSLSLTISWSLPKFMSIESMIPCNHLILCCPLVLLPSVFPRTRVFSSESALPIRWPKYWSFSFSISPFNEYSGLMSFRIDWFDLLAVQATIRVFSSTIL